MIDNTLVDDTIELLCEGQRLLTNAQWHRGMHMADDAFVEKYEIALEQRKSAVKQFLIKLMEIQ